MPQELHQYRDRRSEGALHQVRNVLSNVFPVLFYIGLYWFVLVNVGLYQFMLVCIGVYWLVFVYGLYQPEYILGCICIGLYLYWFVVECICIGLLASRLDWVCFLLVLTCAGEY